MLTRTVVAVAIMIGAGAYARGASGPEHVPSRPPLAGVPTSIAGRTGYDAPPLADDVAAQLGVDDYINRRYLSDGTAPISLYAGYYASQRQGDTIHSPQNCLPGAGWRPVQSDRMDIAVPGGPVTVNRVVIQKGMDRQAVLYWYQGRGRVIAGEFAHKGWLMLDAARLHRTDGGLVRLITPITASPESSFASLAAFSASLFPHLSTHLP